MNANHVDPDVLRRNRELIAQRCGWPAGALADCIALEAEFPGWVVSWSTDLFGGPDRFLAAPASGRFAWHRFTRPAAADVRAVLALCPHFDRRTGWSPPGGWV